MLFFCHLVNINPDYNRKTRASHPYNGAKCGLTQILLFWGGPCQNGS
jgi:hypothetical protein